MSNSKKIRWFLLSLLLAVTDQMAKYWALSALSAYQAMPIIPFLEFRLAYNTGAAFSFLSQTGNWHLWFFASFSTIMAIVLGVWLVKLPKKPKLKAFSISLILGGALGNLVDRFRLGFVVDFIDVHFKNYHFPVFNLADAWICIGAFLLILVWNRN